MSEINPLVLSFPNFQAGQTIDPNQVNENNAVIRDKINEFIDELDDFNTIVEDAHLKATVAEIDAGIAESKAQAAVEKADDAFDFSTTAIAAAEGAAQDAIDALGQDTEEPYAGALGAYKIAKEVEEDFGNLVLGEIPDGSLTKAKLHEDAVDELLTFDDETEDVESDHFGVKYKLIVDEGQVFLEVSEV